jgi:MSHA pilin protein MshA
MVKNKQQGFTLIELIMVIVILGILAAVALPKFIDLSTEAEVASLKGIVGGAASAMAINYAGCSALDNVATANKCVTVDNCDDVGSLLQGGLDSGYSVAAATLSTTNGATANCTITQTSSTDTATFSGIAAGN